MDYLEINRRAWNKRTEAHVDSDFYDVAGFLRGQTSLTEIELSQMGPVAGKSLLHLQCHFGLDTLSWARQGAQVTGVDLSPVAIAKARELGRAAGLNAQFTCADIYEFGERTDAQYDIVFASYGVVNWLPNLDRWAAIVAQNLKPSGKFYMVEFHPFFDLLSGDSYFYSQEPEISEQGSYTENGRDSIAETATWAHSLSETLGALIGAGLRIDEFSEFPFSPYNCFPGLEEREPNRFHMAGFEHEVPLTYSVLATKFG